MLCCVVFECYVIARAELRSERTAAGVSVVFGDTDFGPSPGAGASADSVSLNGTAGKVIDIDSPVNVVKRLRQTLLMRAGASMDLLALDQNAVLDVEMKMDRGEIPTRVYGGNLQPQPPARASHASHNISVNIDAGNDEAGSSNILSLIHI